MLYLPSGVRVLFGRPPHPARSGARECPLRGRAPGIGRLVRHEPEYVQERIPPPFPHFAPQVAQRTTVSPRTASTDYLAPVCSRNRPRMPFQQPLAFHQAVPGTFRCDTFRLSPQLRQEITGSDRQVFTRNIPDTASFVSRQRKTVRFLLMRFFRIAGFCAQAALRLRGVGAKPILWY